MSFHWQIESRTRRVAIAADRDFTRADVESYLKAVEASGTVTSSKLFDGRAGRPEMGSDDTLALLACFSAAAMYRARWDPSRWS